MDLVVNGQSVYLDPDHPGQSAEQIAILHPTVATISCLSPPKRGQARPMIPTVPTAGCPESWLGSWLGNNADGLLLHHQVFGHAARLPIQIIGHAPNHSTSGAQYSVFPTLDKNVSNLAPLLVVTFGSLDKDHPTFTFPGDGLSISPSRALPLRRALLSVIAPITMVLTFAIPAGWAVVKLLGILVVLWILWNIALLYWRPKTGIRIPSFKQGHTSLEITWSLPWAQPVLENGSQILPTSAPRPISPLRAYLQGIFWRPAHARVLIAFKWLYLAFIGEIEHAYLRLWNSALICTAALCLVYVSIPVKEGPDTADSDILQGKTVSRAHLYGSSC